MVISPAVMIETEILLIFSLTVNKCKVKTYKYDAIYRLKIYIYIYNKG